MFLKKFFLAILALGLGRTLLAEQGQPVLKQNGVVFVQGQEPFALHCLEQAKLLEMEDGEREKLLDKAALAGFNTLVFELPLFGEKGLCPSWGAPDQEKLKQFAHVFHQLQTRLFYAFPVLWTPALIEEMQNSQNAQAGAFWQQERYLGWQSYFIKQLRGLWSVREEEVGPEVLGGWLLYQGPLPANGNIFGAWLKTQKENLAQSGAEAVTGLSLELNDPQGQEAVKKVCTDAAFEAGLDFMFLAAGQKSKDRRLLKAWAEGDMEIPLVWRAPWDTMAPDERADYLDAQGLAGVSGFWPVEALPEPDKPLWKAEELFHGKSLQVALLLRDLNAAMEGKKCVLQVMSNRPCLSELNYGKQFPGDKTLQDSTPVLRHRFTLEDVKSGDKILVQVKAQSEKWGRAVLRSQWVEIP